MCKSQPMAKKIIVVVQNGNNYRLFAEDLKKIYKVGKLRVPPLPKYSDSQLARPSKSMEKIKEMKILAWQYFWRSIFLGGILDDLSYDFLYVLEDFLKLRF